MNKDGQPFQTERTKRLIARERDTFGTKPRRNTVFPVPAAHGRTPNRAGEREFKRRRRAGLIPEEHGLRELRGRDYAPLGQTGHLPNHSRNTDGPHRNSIWPARRERPA